MLSTISQPSLKHNPFDPVCRRTACIAVNALARKEMSARIIEIFFAIPQTIDYLPVDS